jgi:16S rRNA (uracil1498-N3)-methyltransferase
VQNGAVTIAGSLCNHLRDSLRIRAGEELWLGDEQRRRYRVIAARIDRHAITGNVLEQVTGPVPAIPPITLGQALLKGDRMDWVIQKATELGAASLVPLITGHAVVRPRAGRLFPQQERWQKIALEAAQQAERWEVPPVMPPCGTATFFEAQTSASLKVILCERTSGQSFSTLSLPSGPGSHIVLAVGPEGGWKKEEVEQAVACGFVPVTLGKRILRAETAALTALSLLQGRLGELG